MVQDDGSSSSIRVLLAVGGAARERELYAALAEDGFQVVERCLDGPSLAERARAFDADVALASSDLHRLSPASLVAIREARLPLVLLADPPEYERYEGLADCIASSSTEDQVLAALRQAFRHGVTYASAQQVDGARPTADGAEGRGEEGRVLVLLGGKGAPGVTTLAIGLAAALSDRGRRVVLVDADLRGGNVVPYLDLDPSRGILGLGVGRHGASGVPVEDELQDGPGFMVLAGIERPEEHASVGSEALTAAVAGLRETYDEVIVDAGAVVAGSTLAVSEALAKTAGMAVVVAGCDLVAAWNAQCCLRYLRQGAGVAPQAIRVLLNRSEGRSSGYEAREVEHALGMPVLAVIPEDRRAARRAAAQQLPLTHVGGKAARAIRGLATQLTDQTVAFGRQQRRRLPRPRLTALGRR